MKRGLKVQPPQERTFVVMSYNRFPDEKGTERYFGRHNAPLCRVTIVSPMKRGLKGQHGYRGGLERLVTIVSPMKRGLKEPKTSSPVLVMSVLQSFPR